MILVVLILASIAFYEVFVGLRTAVHIHEMSQASRSSFETIKSENMDDDEKAVAMRRASGTMFKATALMLLKTVVAIGAAGLVIGCASLILTAYSFEDFLAYSVTWVGLGSVVIAVLIYGKLRHGRR